VSEVASLLIMNTK